MLKLRPAGYGIADIWNGDGHNPNALLTVLRHFDNAVVTKGAAGDLPKTLFVLDYPLFERLVYNLVVNYDVFGNVGHQALTRVYMDLIRMEAEELFLSFLPPSQRLPLRRSWYRGGLFTELKLRYVFPLVDDTAPTGVVYRHEANAKEELVERVIDEHLSPQVRGRPDALNWKTLPLPQGATAAPALTAPEQALRRIASIKAAKATPFARFLPDLAVVQVRGKDGHARLYSLVHNREHENVSWIFGESDRLAPQEDTLTVMAGVPGAYPNMFFEVPEAEIGLFSRTVARIRSAAGYERLVDRFGVRRSNPKVLDRLRCDQLRSPRQRLRAVGHLGPHALCAGREIGGAAHPAPPVEERGHSRALPESGREDDGSFPAGAQLPNMSFMISDVESQAWLRQGRPKPASNVRNSEKWS